jgi:membrane fusion protein (multidrug efflux system)
LKQQEKQCFSKSVVVAKSKATDKQTDVADANIKTQALLDSAMLNLSYSMLLLQLMGRV